jgi:hypothetical protein
MKPLDGVHEAQAQKTRRRHEEDTSHRFAPFFNSIPSERKIKATTMLTTTIVHRTLAGATT